MDIIEDIKKHIKEQLEMERDNNLKLIKKEIEEGEIGGHYCKSINDVFYVVAATSTIEDYYYVVINRDREIKFISCVGSLEVLNEIPPTTDMYVLDYLIRFDGEEIANDVKQYIEKTKTDVLFTKVNVNGKLY